MNRASLQRKRIQSREVGAGGGHPPQITIEGDYLVLRWPKELAAQTMDAAGMTVERVVREYLIPNLEATRTICFKRRGQITERRRVPDWRARLEAFKFTLELYFIMARRISNNTY